MVFGLGWLGGKTPPPGGCRYFRSRAEIPEEWRSRLEHLAVQWGETYDSYLVTQGKREYFWLPDGEGFVAFTRWGRHALVVGGLVAEPTRREELLTALLEYARRRRWTFSFYNLGRPHLPLFQQHGCQISKCGEEPLVNLERTDWKGKDYEWVRRQENYCKRQGVEFSEVRPDLEDEEYRERIAPELRELSEAHLSETLHGRELQFFVGQFDPHDLSGRRLFLARLEGRVVAFIVCNPCIAGEMWAVEIYRRLPDAPRGVVPFAIMQTLRTLKGEGVKYASLSLIPMLRCDPKLHKGSKIFYFVSGFWWKHLNWLFDVQGIYHFKSRFRPDYREMYMAAYPRVTVGSMIAMGMTWEVIKFNPLRLLRRGKKSGTNRETLATPAWRPERVVRELKQRVDTKPESAQSPHFREGSEPDSPPEESAKCV